MSSVSLRILLLEDNAADADLLQEILAETEAIDWQITWVEFLSDAIQQVKKNLFDLILSDLSLPDAFGLDTVIQLHAAAPDLPIVVLTGQQDEVQGLEAIRQGAQDYLIKGQISYPLLTRTIRYAIERASTQRVMRQQTAAMGACREGIAILNQNWEYTYVNQAYVSMFGYSSAAELIGKPWNILYRETDQNQLEQTLLQTVQQQGFGFAETIGKQQDGGYFNQELGITALEDGGFICTVRDITDRKQAEVALRQSQQELSDFVENASVGLHWVDADGMILWANQYEIDLLGYSREEFIGHHISQFHADKDVLDDILHRLGLNETLHDYEARLRCKDGSVKYFSINSNVFWEDGQFKHTRCFSQDITDRKQAEDAVRRSEAQFRQIFRDAPIGMSISDPQTRQVVEVNPTWCEITGYSALEAACLKIDDITHPDDLACDLQYLDQANRGELDTYTIEKRFVRKDGEARWTNLAVTVLRHENGKPYFSLGMVEDITDRKRAETEILKALEKERELNQLKSNFVSMVSHEFRTPMTTIRTASELLQNFSHKLTDERKEQYFQQIYGAISNVLHLLDEVLLLGRTEAGKLEFNPVPLLLEDFCYELVEIFQLSANNSHTIRFTSECRFIKAEMDETLLRHIFTNLLSNAVKYSPDGCTIDFSLFCHNEMATFVVKDAGIGIPEKDQQRLFETFHRASNVSGIQGTGLGLAIVKSCVDLHQGTIQFESQVGVGTTFTVTLPMSS